MKRIQLGNSVFEGENAVYLLETGQTTLIDTGVATPDTREELVTGLAAHGVAFEDVDRVFLTHWHPDHAGLAGEIQAAGDADVFVHEADAPLVDGSEMAFAEDPDAQTAVFDRWGMPAEARERLRSFYAAVGRGLRGRDAIVTTFTDGDTVDIGGATLEAVHLPGHTAGLSAFAFDPRELPGGSDAADGGSDAVDGGSDAADGGSDAVDGGSDAADGGPAASDRHEDGQRFAEAFTGDALLPRYTPNVGGADVRVDDPLGKYADSLARIIERDWDVAHPGHRERIGDPSRRAAEILDHHRHRTRRVLDVLADGPATAWEVSAALFGELEAIHILHGPGEAFAHLDHLAAAGVVERDGNAYRLVETRADDDEQLEVSGQFPTTRLDGVVDGADG